LRLRTGNLLTVLFAFGGGSGDGWFGFGLVICIAQLVFQILVNQGKVAHMWPAIEATTRAGKIATVVLGVFFIAFCVFGLLTTE
jgi:hypothetical protein